MANPFVHVELATTDIDKAKSFYRSLFDWQLQDMDMGGGMSYTMIGVGEGTGGGVMKQPGPREPSGWLAYVLVDDVAAATAKAKSLGATVMRDVMEVPNTGSFSIIIAPRGTRNRSPIFMRSKGMSCCVPRRKSRRSASGTSPPPWPSCAGAANAPAKS